MMLYSMLVIGYVNIIKTLLYSLGAQVLGGDRK